MNQPSEQLLTNQTKTLALDTPLSTKEIFTKTFKILGESNCRIEKLDNHSFLIYKDIHNVDQILLMASVTYLGNPHPKYKKRRQLKQ
ncbi:hypothetical protein FACS1894166_11310 [Bacilli bacterium]|nr:hypothetical protein FACS1894166_11310 [Bacilli bacterium]